MISLLAMVLSACSANETTPTPTRLATQTPWIIYVPVTVTAEPATVTPLPTSGPAPTETRSVRPTATRAPVVAVKPTATKPPVAPPVAVVPPTAAPPACSLGTVTPREPEPDALRRTKSTSVGGDTFIFIWNPPQGMTGATDPNVGYKLEIAAQRPGFKNGANLFLLHNKYFDPDKQYVKFILDKPAVSTLAAGEKVEVNWKVTIIRAVGGFSDDPMVSPSGAVPCGPPTDLRYIHLDVYE